MFRNIPSVTLRKLVALSERKEALMARIQDIEHEMVRIQRGIEAAQSGDHERAQLRITRPAKKTRRQRTARGELKNKVLAALRTAGKRGTTIGDLSKKLGVKRANLYVWFNGTGRSIRSVKKIGPAKYRFG
jgi:phage-related minor tail protein